MIEDIGMAVIATVIVIAVIAFIVVAVFSFSTIVKGNEASMVLLDISESLMSSDYILNDDTGNPIGTLTSSRAVFNEETLKAMDRTAIEPVRHCKFASCIVFYNISNGAKHRISRIGYPQHQSLMLFCPVSGPIMEKTNAEHISQTFPIGIKTKNNLIVPGQMELHTYYSALTRITCAVEDAWKYADIGQLKLELNFDVTSGNEPDTLCLFDPTINKEVECRHMPGFNNKNFIDFYKPDSIITRIVIIPIKASAPSTCRYYGDTDDDHFIDDPDGLKKEINNNIAREPDPNNRILLCPVK